MTVQNSSGADEQVILSLTEVGALAREILEANGMAAQTATIVADRIVAAERDGPSSHGLFMIPSYVSGLRSGWISGRAIPVIAAPRGGVLVADGGNGIAQRALEDARPELCRMARQNGIALLTIRNAHHIGALRADVEPFALAGFVALSCLGTRPWMTLPGSGTRLLGTNPIAFASPGGSREPFVWDMATSGVSVTDVRVAAAAGAEVGTGLGVDAVGRATTDPEAILQGGALLPFGRHKGVALAMMVEVLAAGLTGGNFAVEDRSHEVPGAASANGGQVVVLIDPAAGSDAGFARRVEGWLAHLEPAGNGRVPGDGRLERRRNSQVQGVSLSRSLQSKLEACRGPRPSPP